MPNTKLRLDDLVSRGKTGRETTKLLNVKVPTALLERIGALANKLRVKKTEVVIAILNEGLEPLKIAKIPSAVLVRNRWPRERAACRCREQVTFFVTAYDHTARMHQHEFSGGTGWACWACVASMHAIPEGEHAEERYPLGGTP
jgi:hypothetical protein